MTRVAVWDGAGIEIRSVPMPALQPGDTLVRIRMATVCGSDLHTVSGRRPGPQPSVLGHEAVGDVVVAGAGSGVTVGDRVIWSVTVTCGDCARCRSGRSAKCYSVRKVGHEAMDGKWPLSGGYAHHIVLPSGTTFARVPDGMPDPVAAPAACATATVMAALEAAGPLPGRHVLICGAGMLGVTAAAACAHAGAHFEVVDLDERRVAVARRFGAGTDTGAPVDIGIDFTGAAPAVSAALGRLDIGGVLVLAGSVLPGPSISVDPEAVVRQWLTITGVHNYEPRHLIRAVEFLDATAEVFPWPELVGAPVPLEEIGTVLTSPTGGFLRSAVVM
ncbi:alcohol dehydrogenase catalytic domain-containing protein [soil metagenome]